MSEALHIRNDVPPASQPAEPTCELGDSQPEVGEVVMCEPCRDPETGAEVQAEAGATLGEGAVGISADADTLGAIEAAGLTALLSSAVVRVSVGPGTPSPLRLRLPLTSEVGPDPPVLIRADEAGEWEIVKECTFSEGFVETTIQRPPTPVPVTEPAGSADGEQPASEAIAAAAAPALPSPPPSPPEQKDLCAALASVTFFALDRRSVSTARLVVLAKSVESRLLLNFVLVEEGSVVPPAEYNVVGSFESLQVMRSSEVVMQAWDIDNRSTFSGAIQSSSGSEAVTMPPWPGHGRVETCDLVATPLLDHAVPAVKVKAPPLRYEYVKILDLSQLRPVATAAHHGPHTPPPVPAPTPLPPLTTPSPQPVPWPLPSSHPKPRVVFLNYRRTVDGDSSRDLPDHQLAQRFHDQLHASGRFAWWANSDIPGFGIPPGQPFDEGLADGLARAHSFVALLSQAGLARLALLAADSPCDMVLVRRALTSHSAPCGAFGMTCWLTDDCACPAARWNFGWPTSCGAAAASPES